MLDGLMFDNLFFYSLMDGIVRAKASVRPGLFDMVVMSLVFKGNTFEFIGLRPTKICMVLCDSHQYWF